MTELLHYIVQGGATGVLVLVVVSFVKGWIVPGGVHDRVLRERDRLFEIVVTTSAAAEKALEIAQRARSGTSLSGEGGEQ